MNWLSKNAAAIGALSAMVTATVAVAALVGVKLQLDAADAVQRAQSAREAYRSHLALAVSHPAFAEPEDTCGLLKESKAGAYSAFVDHLLYSAEQMLDIETGWDATFRDALEPHSVYICAVVGRSGSTPRMAAFITQFKEDHCQAVSPCQ